MRNGSWASTELPTLKQSCGSLSIILQSQMLGKVTRPAMASARQLKECQREASFRSADITVKDYGSEGGGQTTRREKNNVASQHRHKTAVRTLPNRASPQSNSQHLEVIRLKTIHSAAALARPSLNAAPSQSTSPSTSKKLICRSLSICRSSSKHDNVGTPKRAVGR